VFDQVYVMTHGGRSNQRSLPFSLYTNGFNDFNMGLAAAEAFILFAIIFSLTLIQRRFIDTAIEY